MKVVGRWAVRLAGSNPTMGLFFFRHFFLIFLFSLSPPFLFFLPCFPFFSPPFHFPLQARSATSMLKHFSSFNENDWSGLHYCCTLDSIKVSAHASSLWGVTIPLTQPPPQPNPPSTIYCTERNPDCNLVYTSSIYSCYIIIVSSLDHGLGTRLHPKHCSMKTLLPAHNTVYTIKWLQTHL